MKKFIMSLIIGRFLLPISAFTQETFINRIFQEESGSPQFNPMLNTFGVQWSKTISSAAGGIITVGYTSVSGEGQNFLLTKYDASGNVIFQTDFNSSGSNNDYGIGILEAPNGDIFLCGTTDNGGSTNYDAVLLRYNSSGTLLNSVIQDGPLGGNDFAVSVVKDPTTGNIIVAGNTEGTLGFSDMWILKYTTGLVLSGSNTYDYASLNDFALGLSITGSTVKIIGPSASSASSCDYVQVNYNINSLTLGTVTRNNIAGTALDQATDFCKDSNDNIYITGRTWSGTNFKIKTIKINANFSLGWSMIYDPYGMDNTGSSIAVDGSGNIIVAGYCTNAINKREMVCLKYTSSGGALVWSFNRSATDSQGDALIKKVSINPVTDDIYFIGSDKTPVGDKVLVGKIRPAGSLGWQKHVGNSPNLIYQPSDILFDSGEIFAISVKDSLTEEYITTAYEELTLDTTRTFSNGQPIFMAKELLIDFMPTAINKATIDNEVGTRISEFGELSDFLTTPAMAAINLAFEADCPGCRFNVVRVHPTLKTTDTISENNLGMTVPTPPSWSILLVQIPSGITTQKAKKIFSSVKNYVSYVQYNSFTELTSPPNDSLYSAQLALHPVGVNTNAHINVEDAWNVVTGCGASFVKGGIFDSGVMWRHKDFGYNGGPTSGKIEGWHFSYGFNSPTGGENIKSTTYIINDSEFDSQPSGGHGTAVAGIIGAKRNNVSGISGIAGGDDVNGNNGVSLYSLNTASLNKMFWFLRSLRAAHSRSGQNPLPYNYGVHFSNHSYKVTPGWWGADSLPLYRDEVHFANRMQVTFIASRGNDGTNNFVAPANYDSCWAISVGGSDINGTKWSGSSYGSGMDIIAPATTNIVTTTASDRYYKSFSGTSAAAPHASGVVALLMSYMNNPNGNSDYMNLAPEDCDFIIQRSATDVGPSGYDSLNGYGRLNAGGALRMVEKPVKAFYHFGTNSWTPHSITKTVHSSWNQVELTEKYITPNQIVYNPGKYVVQAFEIQATVSHPGLYPSDSVMYHWARHSSCNVYDLPNLQMKLDMHERAKFVSFSPSSATLKGYIYQVKDSTGTSLLGWWPCDTTWAVMNQWNQSLFEYSVLSKNKAVGIAKNTLNTRGFTIFPNPANGQQEIVLQVNKEGVCRIELLDIMGRHIRTVYQGRMHAGTNKLQHTVADLPNSMYIYLVNIDGETTTKKFIKE